VHISLVPEQNQNYTITLSYIITKSISWFPQVVKFPKTQQQNSMTGCVVHEKSCVPSMVLEGKHEYI
jgi:hypothetical protein